MAPGVLHLHTYFSLPVLHRQADRAGGAREPVAERAGAGSTAWTSGSPRTADARPSPWPPGSGPWRRAAYTRFDVDSPAYQDMVFFHPIVRRVFFDTADDSGAAGEHEALLRCYEIPIPEGTKLWFEAEDAKGRQAQVEVTDLRLFLFANGIGILSIGVEAFNLTAAEALWINETMRKVYPSSGRQIREGRFPSRMALMLERGGVQADRWWRRRSSRRTMTGVPAASVQDHHRPALLRRLPAAGVRAGARRADDRLHLRRPRSRRSARGLHRIRGLPGPAEPFSVRGPRRRGLPLRAGVHPRRRCERQIYRRWAHQGTYYGFTSYSNITAAIGSLRLRRAPAPRGLPDPPHVQHALLPDGAGGALLPRHAARFLRAHRAGLQAALPGPGGRPVRRREHPAGQRPARRLPALLQLLALRGAGQQGRGDRALRHAVPRVPHRHR